MLRSAVARTLCAAVAFAVAGSTNVARAETATGGAYVATLPSGADVWIDGTYVGRAPVFIDALTPGHHAVTLTKSGWVTREVDVSVAASTVALSSTRLMAGPRALAGGATGTVTFRAVPEGADLALDGHPFDVPRGALTLDAGTHHLTVTTTHGKSTRAFSVLPDTPTQVVLREPVGDDPARSGVVAPADDYLPGTAVSVEGKKIVVRYAGHLVIAHYGAYDVKMDGAPFTCDAAPESIAGRLYLPLELLQKLTVATAKSP